MSYALAFPARSFDRSFERFVNDTVFAPVARGLTFQRGLNFTQDDKAWTLTLDLPGVARDQLAVNVEGAVVRVATTEQAARQFKAAWQLPEDIDAEATEARLQDGVLTLVLGKKQPVSTARTIEVK